jgi:hypothetical protein
LIDKCVDGKWRTVHQLAQRTQFAASAIGKALPRLGGDAVKMRAGENGDEHLIEGKRDELLVRAGLVMAQPDQSAADSSAEIASLRTENDSLRAENDDLRAKLADAKAEINRLRSEAGMMNSAPSRVHAR